MANSTTFDWRRQHFRTNKIKLQRGINTMFLSRAQKRGTKTRFGLNVCAAKVKRYKMAANKKSFFHFHASLAECVECVDFVRTTSSALCYSFFRYDCASLDAYLNVSKWQSERGKWQDSDRMKCAPLGMHSIYIMYFRWSQRVSEWSNIHILCILYIKFIQLW